MSRLAHRIIVSNRLPFAYHAETGELTTAAGGLISALKGGRFNERYIWVGAAPDQVTPDLWEKLIHNIDSKMTFVPVFLDPNMYENYYSGFSNSVLWPLLHYDVELIKFQPKLWKAYAAVNGKFMRTILTIAKTGDIVWVHDYHLMLLPQLIKQRRPFLKVGFFLHIPFPESTIFQKMPMQQEILYGLLGADLIGFHLYQYLQNFCSAINNVLGLSCNSLKIEQSRHTTYLGAFPVSIDTQKFRKRAKSAAVKALTRSCAQREFTFLSIERLDYIKGVDLKLTAYHHLLNIHPEYIGKVLLLQVAIPTRKNIPAYKQLKLKIEKMIDGINREFQTATWRPIHYIYDHIQFDQLLALYRSSDALIVTSKHDGMNLVVFEYIAAQNQNHPGVVILSEFAGAISTLSEVIPINPWNIDETTDTMHTVIHMKKSERIKRHEIMLTYLRKYTAKKWAASFVRRIEEINIKNNYIPTLMTVNQLIKKIQEKFLDSKKLLTLFLDYDGTLTPIVKHPELAHLPGQTYALLKQLSAKACINIVIISGRPADFLMRQFPSTPFDLCAEHGAMHFDAKEKKWDTLVNFNPKEWFDTIKRIMQDFTDRVPNSFIEQKKFSLAWHYRQSPSKFADQQAICLKDTLDTAFSNAPVTIQQGKKVVEIKIIEANKGFFIRWFHKTHKDSSHLLAIGDDATDEDLFLAVQALNGMTIKIGAGASSANYRMSTQKNVLTLLKKLNKLTALS
jgi:trehalose 6-phosphate synthase/phosphatase